MHSFWQVEFLNRYVGFWNLRHEGADGVDARDVDGEGEERGEDVGAGDDEDIVELGVVEVGLNYCVGGGDEEEDEQE